MSASRGHLPRLLSIVALMLAAGIIPAASADAAPSPSTTPGAAAAKFGVRLLDVPASERDSQRALRYIVDYLPTGSVIHRRILIENQQPTVAHLTIYPDAATISNGRFVGEAGQTRSELTTWMSVAHPALAIAPHQQVTDMVSIRVPAGATRGEHYGVIWVQETAQARARRSFAILTVNRVGIRVYLAVGHGGAPPTSFRITSVAGTITPGGAPMIVAHVTNTGARAIDLSGTAALTRGPGGASAGPYPEQHVMTFAHGQSGIVTFPASKGLDHGPWRATVTLVSGFTTATLGATVSFGATTAALSLPSSAAYTGLPALALLIAGALGWRWRRKRRART